MRGLRGIVTIQRLKSRWPLLVGLLSLLVVMGIALPMARNSTTTAPTSAAATPAPSDTLTSEFANEITPSPELTSAPAEVVPTADVAPAIADLNSLRVKGRAPRSGYARDEFGPAWADIDSNGCDTRNDILNAELTAAVVEGDCTVIAGGFTDPYTEMQGDFASMRNSIQIDHVVALSDAWQKGAQKWPFAKRVAFANDPLELQATLGDVNQQKSDSDAASWLPPSRQYWCPFVAQQIAIKKKYDLWVTPAEKDAMMRVLGSCPSQAVPVPGPQPTLAVGPAARQDTTPPVDVPSDSSSSGVSGGLDPDFGTCRAAKASGFGPYVNGVNPEYAYYRDADHDGTVCE